MIYLIVGFLLGVIVGNATVRAFVTSQLLNLRDAIRARMGSK